MTLYWSARPGQQRQQIISLLWVTMQSASTTSSARCSAFENHSLQWPVCKLQLCL